MQCQATETISVGFHDLITSFLWDIFSGPNGMSRVRAYPITFAKELVALTQFQTSRYRDLVCIIMMRKPMLVPRFESKPCLDLFIALLNYGLFSRTWRCLTTTPTVSVWAKASAHGKTFSKQPQLITARKYNMHLSSLYSSQWKYILYTPLWGFNTSF